MKAAKSFPWEVRSGRTFLKKHFAAWYLLLSYSFGFPSLSSRPVPVPILSQRFLRGGTRMTCRKQPASDIPMHTHRRYLPGRQGIQFSRFSGRSTSPSTNPRKNRWKGTIRIEKKDFWFLKILKKHTISVRACFLHRIGLYCYYN